MAAAALGSKMLAYDWKSNGAQAGRECKRLLSLHNSEGTFELAPMALIGPLELLGVQQKMAEVLTVGMCNSAIEREGDKKAYNLCPALTLI